MMVGGFDSRPTRELVIQRTYEQWHLELRRAFYPVSSIVVYLVLLVASLMKGCINFKRSYCFGNQVIVIGVPVLGGALR